MASVLLLIAQYIYKAEDVSVKGGAWWFQMFLMGWKSESKWAANGKAPVVLRSYW